MERLTQKDENGAYKLKTMNSNLAESVINVGIALRLLGEYEDTELAPIKIIKLQKENFELKTKLGINKEFMTREDYLELIQAEENEKNKYKEENAELKARLEKSVELPCKVGDTVYFSSFFSFGILEDIVTKVSFIRNGWSIGTRERRFSNDEFNRKFFLTQEAAEKALKEREDNE